MFISKNKGGIEITGGGMRWLKPSQSLFWCANNKAIACRSPLTWALTKISIKPWESENTSWKEDDKLLPAFWRGLSGLHSWNNLWTCSHLKWSKMPRPHHHRLLVSTADTHCWIHSVALGHTHEGMGTSGSPTGHIRVWEAIFLATSLHQCCVIALTPFRTLTEHLGKRSTGFRPSASTISFLHVSHWLLHWED